MTFNFTEQMTALKNKEREVLECGKNHGIDENPATPDTQFNAAQLDIKFECQSVARHLITETKKQVSEYANQLNSHEASLRDGVALPDIDNMKSSSAQSVRSYLAKESQGFIQATVDAWNAERGRSNFLREKGITSVSSGEPVSAKAHYMTITAYAVIETVINIFIFNGGLSGPDALLLSLFISVLNIFPAVIVGNYLRNINGDDSIKKKLSVALIFVWGLFVLWLNTALAILRSYLTEMSAQSSENALSNAQNIFSNAHIFDIFFRDSFSVFMLQAPPIRDVLSIFLWLVGILAALIACWKGYTSDEKVPELGGLNRDYFTKKETYNNYEKKIRDDVSSIFANNLSIFQTIRSDFDRNRRDYISCSALLGGKISDFEREYKQVEGQYVHLINLYRDGNKSARKSFPPEYFLDTQPDLELSYEMPDFSKYSEAELKSRIENIEILYKQKIDALNELQSNFYSHIDELNSLLESKMKEFDQSARKLMENLF